MYTLAAIRPQHISAKLSQYHHNGANKINWTTEIANQSK